MHEWSVAEAVIKTVQDWADGRKVKIKRVVLGIPAVSFLDSDLLKEAFDTLKRDSILEGATLIVRFKSPTFHCNSCNRDFSLDDVKDQLDKVRAEFGEDYPMHLIPALAPAFIRLSVLRLPRHLRQGPGHNDRPAGGGGGRRPSGLWLRTGSPGGRS